MSSFSSASLLFSSTMLSSSSLLSSSLLSSSTLISSISAPVVMPMFMTMSVSASESQSEPEETPTSRISSSIKSYISRCCSSKTLYIRNVSGMFCMVLACIAGGFFTADTKGGKCCSSNKSLVIL
ncbi:hypothetical protein F4809DRAFT_612105 [Biscogniauxia mediterranea]|nr:hypothetical protein F4809DRAFT_612105 [Biscogniauxia mediterranea]